jgi:ferrochelatase
MPNDGIKHVAVICPGLSSDCLETIEEIDGEGREIFTEHGGETFHYIPCLNADPKHLKALAKIVSKYL